MGEGFVYPATVKSLFLPGRPGIRVYRGMPWHLMRATVRHFSPDGDLLWEGKDLDNVLHDTGTEFLLSAALATTMTNFGGAAYSFLGLDKRTTPAQTDTLASLSLENTLGSNGYSRLPFSNGGTGASGQDWYISKATYYNAVNKTTGGANTWTCVSANWGQTVKNLFVCTDSTSSSADTTDADDAHLVCSVALSAERTILVGDTLTVSITITPS